MDLKDFAEAMTPGQYGTSMHWPYCNYHNCTGCVPAPERNYVEPSRPLFDLQIFKESRIETRPQDWAAPARAILEARGAWRS
jgi:hypothetical protein